MGQQLVATPELNSEAPGPEGVHFDLVRRALGRLAEKRSAPWIDEAEILSMVKRLDPTFTNARASALQ